MPRLIQYEDFALAIEQVGNSAYRVRTLSSPYGPAVEPFVFPFRRQQLEEMIEAVGIGVLWRHAYTSPVVSGESRDGWTLKDVGIHLFRALFPGTLHERYLQNRGRTEATPDRGLRIRIVLPVETADAGLLQALPWELLHCEQSQDFLARNVLTPVVRQIGVPGVSPSISLPATPQIRILIAVANPRGMAPLRDADERARILEAWCRQEKVEVKVLKAATLRNLYEALRSNHYQVVHFIAHGCFDSASGIGSLILETTEGDSHVVAGGVLAETLRASRELRLVFLNSCESAQIGYRVGQNPLLGTTAALVHRGVPAVLAMRFPIADQAAAGFSEAVYRSLARGSSLEAAVTDGRLALLHAAEAGWEWATPVLTTALAEPSVFWPLCKAEDDRTVREVMEISRAIRLMISGAYDQATLVLNDCLEKEPDLAEVHYCLALARLRGRRPRDLKLSDLRPIEAAARRVLGSDGCAAHHLCFLAFLQQDFYKENYLLAPEPGCETLLKRAASLGPEPTKLRELVRLVPWASALAELLAERQKSSYHDGIPHLRR